MSVQVPNHLTICPSLLRRGSARPSIQWYSPSWRRRRYSISYGWPVEVASFQSLQATGRSSGWNGGFHPSPRLSSSVSPVNSSHWRLTCSCQPSGRVIHTIWGSVSTSVRHSASLASSRASSSRR